MPERYLEYDGWMEEANDEAAEQAERKAHKPRLLDLFCGAGGAAMGYQLAGFEVWGVDIASQPRYCGERFQQMDAFAYMERYGWDNFDAIHASPPCQRFSSMTGRWGRNLDHPDLIQQTRDLLGSTGLPYVIENVVGAPLEDPICLCGRSFGLPIRRHRLFELGGFTIPLIPPCSCGDGPALQVNGHAGGSSKRDPGARFGSTKEWSEGMEIDWMTGGELAEAIPPAYTQFIGDHLRAQLRPQESLAWHFSHPDYEDRPSWDDDDRAYDLWKESGKPA